MLPSEFWKGRQAEFEKYAKQYSDLRAHWSAASQGWFLWWGTTPSGMYVPQECKDVFNAIARNVIAELPRSQNSADVEPWILWLDYMRVRKWGFRVTGHTPCTELEWERGVKDGKPLDTVRRQQKYTDGDEWKKVYRRTASGKLQRLTARELKGKSSDDLQQYYHWLEDGAIEDVFGSSARFCEDLASRTREIETSVAPLSGKSESQPALVVGTSTDPDYWLRARENFRSLQPRPPQPGEVSHESHNGLCALWYSWRDSNKKWSFDNDSDATKALFRAAAESAAVELGHEGGPFAVSYWLDLLLREAIFYRPWPDGGEIYQVCNASAAYCVKLETAAKVAKRNLVTHQERVADSKVPKSSKMQHAPRKRGAQADGFPSLKTWEELDIRFLSDNRVQITVGEKTQTRNYSEFGFEDGRSQKANLAWLTLRSFAQLNGTIQRANKNQKWGTVEKRMQEIRRVLRTHFSLESDPILFLEGTGYRTCFRISCAPSFNT